ncbi:UPF0047 protein YjbQ-like isoform X1 [Tubulanus polymorphus]|uniref:UPF0047 protein YjbQ-like isoform X1 n=1 Tax=Tubulanus polymorphus TaxID=672921 RepID=UPI003DA5AE29
MATVWFQHEIQLPSRSRGCYLIIGEIEKIQDIKKVKIGLCNIFLKHTSASLCLNESYDPDVRTDMEMMLDRLAPENAPYQHTAEGADDMPAHVKNALLGSSVTIPIKNGQLVTGTWQSLWFCEHRRSKHSRQVVVTIQGQTQ